MKTHILARFKPIALSVIALAVFALGQSSAMADPILPGTTCVAPCPSNTVFQGGALLASNSGPLANAAFNGTARVAVYRNASGFLDFYYQFTNNASSMDSINRLSGFNFAGFTTSIFNITNGSAVGVGFIDGTIDSITADRNLAGSTVGFNYGGAAGDSLFVPGTTNLALLIQTNATDFTIGNFAISDGVVENFRAFQPAAIPEPATMVLLGTGLAGLAARARRRRTAAAQQ